ncbi:MAG TPA: class I adenylate-forming enzyme family protein [Acidimicrobiales bacterium]|nr:class I adenylate-forming enzyme family protein [Acidimicrobiales bacterium]
MTDQRAPMAMSRQAAEAELTGRGAPFEVGEAVVRGQRTKIWVQAPGSLVEILGASRGYGDRTFLSYEDERMTFEEHFGAAAALANLLVDRFGVRPGDRVAIAMRNYPEWPVVFWAGAATGAILVPLNGWWSGDELAYGLADSGTKVLVCDAERERRLAPYWSDLNHLASVIVVREAGDGKADGEGHREHRGAPGRAVFEDLMAGSCGRRDDLPDVVIHPDDDATIFYTSGTTGRPKGAIGTHRNICTNPMSLLFVAARAALRSPAPGPERPSERETGPERPSEREGGSNVVLLSVPLFHATGCHSVLVSNTLAGGTLVMMRRWDPARALALIERERVTNFGGVPGMVMEVLDHPDFARRDTSSVRSVSYGGAPAPPDLVRRITEQFPGGSPSNGYGLTETSSVSTMNQGADYVARPDSVGTPVPVVDLKVVDVAGADLPTGAVGELWVKGPNVVRGYWHKPEATAATFTDGWLHTGDVARIDDEGFVYIVDRAKDVLIRGGENIYCVEIEAVLHEHPAVADAAVIGIPHDVLGEEVGAVVRVRDDFDVDEVALCEHVATRLAVFKVPARVWMVRRPLPRNPAGKILKRQLREELIGEGDSQCSDL